MKETTTVGIDVSKDSFDAHIDSTSQFLHLENTPAGIQFMVRKLNHRFKNFLTMNIDT